MSDELLSKLCGEVGELRGTVESQLKQLTERSIAHDVMLLGRPPENVGLATRTDRLEQVHERQKKHVWLIWGAIVSGCLSWAISAIRAKVG